MKTQLDLNQTASRQKIFMIIAQGYILARRNKVDLETRLEQDTMHRLMNSKKGRKRHMQA